MGADRAASSWALVGVVALFTEAIVNLGRRGLGTVRAGLDGWEWLALLVLTAAFVYGEGVRALQRKWAPRVLARSAAVAGERSLTLRLLAPLYAMMLVGAPRATLVRAWLGISTIVAAVLLVRALPSPWRGIIDLAVAAALLWGLGALLVGAWRARRQPRGRRFRERRRGTPGPTRAPSSAAGPTPTRRG